ncbi:hypothetical protein Patl1_12330 [Pistacia atlantica]|uniref:Uncharacterized protein n=1 Tax=Pistacia atlantica TaxID=434234 RepID=A0ACC1A0N7_9ROSI|nr:hypothetical protein Patl1_12330 [Pistacia atlantica]
MAAQMLRMSATKVKLVFVFCLVTEKADREKK